MKIGIAYQRHGWSRGIERVSAELAERAAGAGHEVSYHCVSHSTDRRSQVRFHRVPGPTSMNSLSIILFPLLVGRQLAKGGYDLTHSYGTVAGCDLVSAGSCHKAALNRLAQYTSEPTDDSKNWGIADRFRLQIERRLYLERRFRKVLACSSRVKRELQENYSVQPADIEVIPNGVDLDEFNPLLRKSRRMVERERLGIRDEDLLMLFVGNEFGRKGLRTVVRSMSMPGLASTKLLVCGRGNPDPYRRLAAGLGVGNRIIFAGGREDIAACYTAADLFVFPTLYEPFGMVITEAMASGLPVVVSREAGAAEDHLEHGKSAALLENPTDPAELAAKVSRLLEDVNLRSRIAGAGLETVRNLGWESIAGRVLQVYESLLKEKWLR